MIIIRKRKIIAGSLLLGLSDSKVLMLGGRIKNKGQENQIRIIARLPSDILYAAKRWQAANHRCCRNRLTNGRIATKCRCCCALDLSPHMASRCIMRDYARRMKRSDGWKRRYRRASKHKL